MRYALLVTTALLMSADLSARADTPTGEDSPTFRLEVRVHLLTSKDLSALNCTLSDDEIRDLFAGVNDIWKQAGIVWEVESIVREPAAQEMQGRFATLIQKSKQVPRKLDISEMRDVVRKIYSTDNQLAGGWNLYIAEDLGRTIGGAYHAGSQSLLFAKHGPRGLQTPIVLAHEFGHSLGLPHVAETFNNNLMMTASPLRSPNTSTVLVQQQIVAARHQADLGTPRDVSQKVRNLFEVNDSNADGVVTRDEARPIFLHNFATYDANEDGQVELLEFQNAFDKTVRPSRPQNAAAEPGMPEYQQAERALGQRILGVAVDLVDEGTGLLVKQVLPESPAAHAGVQVGDRVIRIDEKQIDELSQMRDAVKDGGDTKKVVVLRLGKELELTANLRPTTEKGAAAVGQAAESRTEQVRAMLRERFAEADSNSDGSLSAAESQAPTRPVVPPQMFTRSDQNSDGVLDQDEFKSLLLRVRVGRSQTQRRATGSVFQQYDQDSDGKLSRDEVGDSWERVAPFDNNQDGTIDQQEFAKAQSKRSEEFKESFRRRFTEADADSDGRVTVAESQAGQRPLFPATVFQRNDQDSSGTLDPQELDSFLTRARVAVLPPRRQAAGSDFDPKVDNPAYPEGQGPVVLIDENHFNYHTADGRYAPFAKLLRRDGYVVRPNREKFTREVLDRAKALVISNALAQQNQSNWSLPTPSAFTQEEIADVVKWVSDGGSLLLIADHMPFAGAAQELASAFDVQFLNGFALPEVRQGAMRFRREDRQLHDHAVTRGRDETERIDSVSTFTGSAFQIGEQFEPILEFGPGVDSLQPQQAWQFSDETPRENVEGWCQAAVGQYGKGRVAVFGEAAMFSAQQSGTGQQFGMNAPEASQNGQLLLNTLHWFDGLLGKQ